MILFFSSLFQGRITGCYVFILPLCYPGISSDIIIPGYLSVSLGDLIHHTTSPHSCHEHDFPRGMKFSIFDSLPFPHPLLLLFSSFHFPHPIRSKTKRETAEIKRSLSLSLCFSPFLLSRFLHPTSRHRVCVPAAVPILLVTFFTCEQVSDLRANLSTSLGRQGRKSEQGRTLGRGCVPSWCMPKHEGGSHLLLNLVKLARARPPLSHPRPSAGGWGDTGPYTRKHLDGKRDGEGRWMGVRERRSLWRG